ncbi:unnamed protein product [Ectocarpus sp. 12 AP-2014]
MGLPARGRMPAWLEHIVIAVTLACCTCAGDGFTGLSSGKFKT